MGHADDSILDDLKMIAKLVGIQRPLSLDSGFQLPALKTANGKVVKGLTAICDHIGSTPQFLEAFPKLKPNSSFSDYEKLLTAQWLEYRMTRMHRNCNGKDLLQNLQGYLKQHVYLIGNRCTLTDVVLYLAVRPLLEKVSPLDREDYTHLGRWFKQVDSLLSTRWSTTIGTKNDTISVVFSKTPLRSGSHSH